MDLRGIGHGLKAVRVTDRIMMAQSSDTSKAWPQGKGLVANACPMHVSSLHPGVLAGFVEEPRVWSTLTGCSDLGFTSQRLRLSRQTSSGDATESECDASGTPDRRKGGAKAKSSRRWIAIRHTHAFSRACLGRVYLCTLQPQPL